MCSGECGGRARDCLLSSKLKERGLPATRGESGSRTGRERNVGDSTCCGELGPCVVVGLAVVLGGEELGPASCNSMLSSCSRSASAVVGDLPVPAIPPNQEPHTQGAHHRTKSSESNKIRKLREIGNVGGDITFRDRVKEE